MKLYELLQEGPAVYIPVLFVSLVVTVCVYAAFPIIFAKTRKKPITTKKYNLLCYGINFLGVIFFILINGASSGAPYVLWTWIFTARGIKILSRRGLVGERTSGTYNDIMQSYAEETARSAKANEKSQPDYENDDDFGFVPEKPIYTLASKSVAGEKEFLDRLYTVEGEKIKWVRSGSVSVEGVHGIVDIYDIYLPSGELYDTIFINMYGAKESKSAPAGFVLKGVLISNEQSKEKPKARYCRECGCIVDSETRVCKGCGKKYFRGIRPKKSLLVVLVLSLALCSSVLFNVFQFLEAKELKKSENYWISRVDTYREQLLEQEELVNFVDDYVVFVEDDGTSLYHKFNCFKFKGESFWVFNTEAAQQQGNSPCVCCQ